MCRAKFHQLSLPENRNAVGQSRRQGNVMRDEDQRHTVFAHQFAQERDNLFLHDGVERACRLIRDQQARTGGNGERNRDALFLPARKLMRIARETCFRLRDTDPLQRATALAFAASLSIFA